MMAHLRHGLHFVKNCNVLRKGLYGVPPERLESVQATVLREELGPFLPYKQSSDTDAPMQQEPCTSGFAEAGSEPSRRNSARPEEGTVGVRQLTAIMCRLLLLQPPFLQPFTKVMFQLFQ
ncbi:hypothetical protein MRX96_002612 [Rhipicephalus microplus]